MMEWLSKWVEEIVAGVVVLFVGTLGWLFKRSVGRIDSLEAQLARKVDTEYYEECRRRQDERIETFRLNVREDIINLHNKIDANHKENTERLDKIILAVNK